MVGKLLKYEFKYYLRLMVIYLPIVVVFGLIARLVGAFEFVYDSFNILASNPIYTLVCAMYTILNGSTMLLFMFISFACLLLTTIMGVVRFYKNLYSTDGYLTFTLPVSNNKLLFTKLFTFVVCQFITLIVVAIPWIIMGLTSKGAITIYQYIIENFNLVDFINSIINNFMSVFTTLFHGIAFLIEYTVLFVVSIIASVLIYFSCISIGQLVNKGRIILSIGVYYGYNWLSQAIVSFLYMGFYAFLIIMILFFSEEALDLFANFFEMYVEWIIHFVLIISILFTAAFATGLYLFNLYIMNKKLNLE